MARDVNAPRLARGLTSGVGQVVMPATLTVASYNIRYDTPRDGANQWRHRRYAVQTQLESIGFDVCGIQEVVLGQRDFLTTALPGTRWYGVGRADGAQEGEQSPIVVQGERLRVTDWTTLWLSERPQVAGSRGWDAKIPRVATVLYGAVAGTAIGVVNTHLDHRGRLAQVSSARLIADWVRSHSDRRWIVMGDFNVALGSPAMNELTGGGLRSVLPEAAGGTFHAWSGALDRQRIDHILVDDGWEVVNGQILHDRPGGRLPSDHWPIIAVLRLRNEA